MNHILYDILGTLIFQNCILGFWLGIYLGRRNK